MNSFHPALLSLQFQQNFCSVLFPLQLEADVAKPMLSRIAPELSVASQVYPGFAFFSPVTAQHFTF